MFTDNETLIKSNCNYKYKESKRGIKYYGSILTISFSSKLIGGTHVGIILTSLNYYLKKYGRKIKHVSLEFENLVPADKLSYIMIEVILYLLQKRYGIGVGISGEVNADINTHGLYESILCEWGNKQANTDYIRLFEKKQRITKHGLRKCVSHIDLDDISYLMSDIKSFLKCFDIREKDRSKIAKVVCELADNACEHAQNDCLVDVDVSELYGKKGDEKGSYYSVNICVLNFSNVLLGEKVKNKILNNYSEKNDRYSALSSAYNRHKCYFDDYYTEEHFFIMSSFQDEISGRVSETETGGKGLAEIVKELENTVDTYSCYVLSGKKGLAFKPETLEIDDEGWISFNRKRDFVFCKPEHSILLYSDTFIPGTGYNLSLIYKKE